jgi:3' terminal RNA ribose 2'-O-methyltransferase Hen1
MAGRAKERQERVDELWPLEVRIEALACAGGPEAARRAFEPLGYDVEIETHRLDDEFPEWGEADIVTLTLRGNQTIRGLLNHLYVLLPALDRHKHYWIGEDEVEKLVREGGEWLAGHPDREAITRGYLVGIRSLMRDAVARLTDEAPADTDGGDGEERLEAKVPGRDGERPVTLNELRHERVAQALEQSGAASFIDLGCGSGQLLKLLRASGRFARLAGMDVSVDALGAASRRLGLERTGTVQRRDVDLFQSSLLYRDERIRGFDGAALVEVVEHVDPARLPTLERLVLDYARPGTIIVTTPNADYNAVWQDLPPGRFRHSDHRFEWTRKEFASWCAGVAGRFGYQAQVEGIGPVSPERPEVGCPTQMAVLRRAGDEP